MALQIASLNSGSNGNCYYIGNNTEAVLIDAGISCRETEKRMKQLGLSPKKLMAIFVSHEHGDHIKGVTGLANKYSLPVYITAATAKNGPRLIRHLSRTFIADEPVVVGSLSITAFAKHHDAADPHSFIIEHNNVRAGVFTDIGYVCDNLIHYFKQCHAAFLESNYDETMLENGSYPHVLKNRIRGGKGHLSNKQALELFINHRSPSMSHLLLSHLSKENNTPELASTLFNQYAEGVSIMVAPRYGPSPLINVGAANKNMAALAKPVQLGLFL